LHTWQRLKGFVLRAGQLIVPICVLIGALNSLNIDGSLNTSGDGHSILSLLGQKMTPIFAPMGIQADNWPATVSLVTGVLAKEVVIGTLNTLYTQIGHLHTVVPASTFDFLGGLQAAWSSILENAAQLKHMLSHPIVPKGPLHTLNQEIHGLMYQHFDGQIGAFAYLLFVLLYLPCISTTAVMLRELHRGWALFSAGWMTGVAYGVAVVFYQVATWQRHPWYSLIWVSVIIALFLGVLALIRWYAHHLLEENLSSLSVERSI
jgi:ferrous iron transport protein B